VRAGGRTDKQTDTHTTKPIVAFRNFAKAPKIIVQINDLFLAYYTWVFKTKVVCGFRWFSGLEGIFHMTSYCAVVSLNTTGLRISMQAAAFHICALLLHIT